MKKRILAITLLLSVVFAVAGIGSVSAASPRFLIYEDVSSGTAPNSYIGTDTSRNWSGYVASGTGYASIGADWTVPRATASTSFAADATWIGIGGLASTDLIQAGTQAVIENGTTTYTAWYELLPASSEAVPMTVNPGDTVQARLTDQLNGTWLISLADLTNGQSYQTTVSYDSSHSSAEWIEEMPSDGSDFVPLDDFGSVSFSGGFAVQNGSQTNITGVDARSMTMIMSDGTALAVPSALGADGASFTITRSNIASSASGAPEGSIGRRVPWTRTGVGIESYGSHPHVNSVLPGVQEGFGGLPPAVLELLERYHANLRGGVRAVFYFGFNR